MAKGRVDIASAELTMKNKELNVHAQQKKYLLIFIRDVKSFSLRCHISTGGTQMAGCN